MKKTVHGVDSLRHNRWPSSTQNLWQNHYRKSLSFSVSPNRNGKKHIGTFNRPEDAIAEGARRFGTESFLVRNVNHSEENLYIPALALGILDARSAQPV